jgi:ABC-2 type transport system permease protein
MLATTLSIIFVVQGTLQVPIEGSITLFLSCAALHLFATTSMGIFMATVARSMPRENMPMLAQSIMLAAPTTHFISACQAILFRGAGFGIVCRQFFALAVIGVTFFVIALSRFRKTIMLL